MAASPPMCPWYFLNKEETNLFMKKLGDNTCPYYILLDVGGQCFATIQAIVDNDNDDKVGTW